MTDPELFFRQLATTEVLEMRFTEAFALVDFGGHDDLRDKLRDLFNDIVDVITEETKSS